MGKTRENKAAYFEKLRELMQQYRECPDWAL
jgi:ribosomal protein L10